MTKYSAIALVACLLAGCTTPPADTASTAGTTVVAKKKCKYTDPPTGSHISDASTCDTPDPFVRHGVLTDRSGNPYQAQGQ